MMLMLLVWMCVCMCVFHVVSLIWISLLTYFSDAHSFESAESYVHCFEVKTIHGLCIIRNICVRRNLDAIISNNVDGTCTTSDLDNLLISQTRWNNVISPNLFVVEHKTILFLSSFHSSEVTPTMLVKSSHCNESCCYDIGWYKNIH